MNLTERLRPTTPLTETAVTVHFGPYEAAVADEHSLFAVVVQLLQQVAPWPEVIACDDGGGADAKGKGHDCGDGPDSLPLVRLPAVIVDEGEEQNGAEGMLNEGLQGREVVMSLGRVALEVRTYSHGVVTVSNWMQWEAVRSVVVHELNGSRLSGGGNTPGAIHHPHPNVGAVKVEIHVELVVLWYNIDTMVALRFENLFLEDDAGANASGASDRRRDSEVKHEAEVEAETEGEGEGEGEGEAEDLNATAGSPGGPGGKHSGSPPTPPPLPPAPVQLTVPAAATEATEAAPAEEEESADGHTAEAQPSPATASAGAPAPVTPSLVATIAVLDDTGVRRGKVQVYVRDPIVGLAELRSLVKGVLGIRRQRGVRLAYRVLPPKDLAPGYIDDGVGAQGPRGQSSAPSGGRSDGPSPPPGLIPLVSQQDVEHLVQDVLFYGYRAIRIIGVETDATEAARRGAPQQPVVAEAVAPVAPVAPPPCVSSSEEPTVNQKNGGNGDGEGAECGSQEEHIRRVKASLSFLHAKHHEQQVEANVESKATLLRVHANATPPLEEPTFSPPPRQPTGSTAPTHNSLGCYPPSNPHDTSDRVNTSDTAIANEHTTAAKRPQTESARSEQQQRRSTDASHGNGAKDDVVQARGGRGRGSQQGTHTKRDVVVVRYEVEPTEVFVSGPVKPQLLLKLASSIYDRCCRSHDSREGASGLEKEVPAFVKVDPDGEAKEDVVSLSVNGKANPDQVYVLRLHQYEFNDDEEDELSACVTEAMQSLDGFQPVELPELF